MSTMLQPLRLGPKSKHGAAWRHPETFRRQVAPEPTRWDLLLREMSIDEDGALELLQPIYERTAMGLRLKLWVRMNWRWRFVPEPVLSRLGLVPDDGIFVLSVSRSRFWRTTPRNGVGGDGEG